MGKRKRQQVDLLHYVDQVNFARERTSTGQHQALQAEIDRRITGINNEIHLAQGALEHRLDQMNEFRQSLADQAARMVSTELFTTTVSALTAAREAGLGALADRVTALETAQARDRGRSQGVTAIIATIGLIATVTTLIILFAHLQV